MIKKARANAGFTLVELSIVLVIIGLIIGGVLSGKQIMQNAQVTNALNAIQAYEAQFQTYVQNYNALPGDDANAAQHFTGANAAANGNGNGTLQGTFDSATASDESRLLWSHLRAAGLVKGAVSTNLPANPFNGVFGFQHGAFGAVFTSNVLCLNNVTGEAAEALDARLDDGVSNSGSIQSMVATGVVGEATNGTVAATYNSSQTYTMCVRM